MKYTIFGYVFLGVIFSAAIMLVYYHQKPNNIYAPVDHLNLSPSKNGTLNYQTPFSPNVPQTELLKPAPIGANTKQTFQNIVYDYAVDYPIGSVVVNRTGDDAVSSSDIRICPTSQCPNSLLEISITGSTRDLFGPEISLNDYVTNRWQTYKQSIVDTPYMQITPISGSQFKGIEAYEYTVIGTYNTDFNPNSPKYQKKDSFLFIKKDWLVYEFLRNPDIESSTAILDSFKFTAGTSFNGILKGHVNIIPSCFSTSQPESCVSFTPSDISSPIIFLENNATKTLIKDTKIDLLGNYQIELAPGSYLIGYTPPASNTKINASPVIIKAGKTTVKDFSIEMTSK